MEKQPTNATPGFRPLTYIAGGFLAILFLTLGIAAFLIKSTQSVHDTPVTPTTVATQLPHVLIRPPQDKSEILKEDFSSNENEWSLYYPYGKLEIIHGKLILQSNLARGFVIGKSQQFAYLEETYYAQADFTSDVDNAFGYGLIFGVGESLETYYMFEVMPKLGSFHLLKYNTGKWEEPVLFTPSTLKPFPQDNTLSVYFDSGDIELYINGDLVSTLTDSNYFRSTGVGVFANQQGYRLIVDNFFAYSK